MSRGDATRQAIVDRALDLVSTVGFEGLSLGDLAASLKLSKSGLFGHFGSKEKLEIEILQAAGDRFVQQVMVPALRAPRGEKRVRALFKGWVEWGVALPGGCIFISAAVELDDRPGPVRDALVKTQRDWLDALAQAARIAVEEGHFRGDLDTEQFAFELYALMLGFHHHQRLLHDPRAAKRAHTAFDRLVAAAAAAAPVTHKT